MCGGTALWGVAHTYCRADTAAGRLWLLRYADSLPGFYPAGTWNNSHNIWLANAYRSAAELTGAGPCWLMHHYLVDTLLMRDTDKDGGIPATWTDPSTQDQTWVSTYLDFMGMDVFVWPPRTHDLAALEFVSPSDREFYLAGDSIEVRVPLANCGLGDETDVRLKVRGPGYADSTLVGLLGFCESETLEFTRFVAAAPGEYELDAITGATADSNPLNDTSHVRFRVYGLWTLSGTVLDSATSDPLHAWVKARIGAGPQVWDSCETNRSGQFALEVIDSLIRLDVEPFAPYYRRSWLVPVHGDTNVTLLLQPAHVALVNCDSAGRYAGYYTSTFDTLGLTCFEWYRPDSNLPWFVLDRLRLRTIVWYSGDAVTGTVPAQDRDSLAAFVGRSGNLLLTGQNVAEELAGTAFLENTVGCRFDSSGVTSFVVFGNRQDSLGRLMPGTSTAGAGGAGNQTSRDAVTPLAGASSFAVYDTTSNICAGTRRQAAGGGRVVFLGFGFEAVNRPSSRPTYFTRVQLMDLVLSWFAGSTAIAEQPPAAARHSPSATIVRGVLHLPRDMTEFGSANSGRVPRLMDVTGRKVADLRPGPNDVRHLPPGLYFLRMASSEGRTANTKVLIVE
jgi:hypothetical protein